jgi:hypothetical protein
MNGATEHGHAIVRRDAHGVLLRYADPAVLRRHHVEQIPRASDSERIALIAAEKALRALEIIAEHLDVSDLGMSRFRRALAVVRIALEAKRSALGLQQPAVQANG